MGHFGGDLDEFTYLLLIFWSKSLIYEDSSRAESV